ncbi:hypothetical protein [Inediibacterium massiliense]|uniref:hypothetical protein n=1 Tax=Inediibacterium massiliense TaxID=1658111 RepID=UPI0006B5004D|nr:hypothetical protein [Inediibacterium massiliense]
MPELTRNIKLKKPLDHETADIKVINENMDKIDNEITELQNKIEDKTEIIVAEKNVPVGERKKGTFYFFITDQVPTQVVENIKVSPTMGIKKI